MDGANRNRYQAFRHLESGRQIEFPLLEVFRTRAQVEALQLGVQHAEIGVAVGNRTAQVDLSTRTQYVQQSLQLEPIYQALVHDLADTAVSGDAQIGSFLSSQGVTFMAKRTESGK